MINRTLLFLLSFLLYSTANAQSRRPVLLDSITLTVQHNNYPNIHSILIAQNGQLVYEQYFNGWKRDSLHDMRSAFKSVTSLLAGIAIDKHFIKNVHQQVVPFFPEYVPIANNDSRKKEMTIQHLLEMRSGFDCEEFNGDKDCEDNMMNTNDWLKYALNLPMKNAPGTQWAYTSIAPMIVGGIISNTSHLSVMDFAKQYLFAPLGITQYRWTKDQHGHATTAGSFFIRPVDMLKFGELVRQNGSWNNRQIVSSAWLQQSTNATIPIPDFSFVKFSRSIVAIPQPTYYGYYWYKELIKTKNYEQEVLFASGNGGQYIMIIKELNLVVVFTQGNYNSWKAKMAFDILAKYILPAFKK